MSQLPDTFIIGGPMRTWLDEVKDEMVRARGLHTSPNLLVSAFTEEAGEAVKAVLDHMQGKGSLSDVRKELIQSAAMVGRLLEEGDPVHHLPPTVMLLPGEPK